MKLDLDRQGAGRTRLAVDERLNLNQDPASGLPAQAEVHGELVVDNLELQVLVRGPLRTTVEVACDRCLESYREQYSADVDIMIVRARVAEPEEDETEARVIHQRTGEVDLDEALREAALLALPQKLLCAEDCRGLCPTCGANLNRESCRCSPAGEIRDGGIPEG